MQNRRAKWRKTSEKNKKKHGVNTTTSTPSSTPDDANSPVISSPTNHKDEDKRNKIHSTQKNGSSSSLKSEIPHVFDNNFKSNLAPRLTHPPYSFPTYQNTYCTSSYGGIEQRGISYPINVETLKDSYSRPETMIPSDSDNIDWRA